MTAREQVTELISKRKFTNASVSESSDIYRDLGFDSLAFVELLVQIEDKLAISFDIEEMESCLNVGVLLNIVEKRCECHAV